ncbi:MAG: putative toxin-antitoxin system toxin component, PIN family [Bacteroidaceae bacterium]|nr:putative toxin-antitoxin system toxin component, PIN family [Bacteroidaceae bacterium]
MNRHVVLDTNCLLQSLSARSPYYKVWSDFVEGRYVLCVSNEILEEYEEIIASHMSPLVARIAIETILRANNILKVDAKFHFELITADVDDNKFVDCAIVANADYIVTEDHHFDVLKSISFPKVNIRRLSEFCEELMQG